MNTTHTHTCRSSWFGFGHNFTVCSSAKAELSLLSSVSVYARVSTTFLRHPSHVWTERSSQASVWCICLCCAHFRTADYGRACAMVEKQFCCCWWLELNQQQSSQRQPYVLLNTCVASLESKTKDRKKKSWICSIRLTVSFALFHTLALCVNHSMGCMGSRRFTSRMYVFWTGEASDCTPHTTVIVCPPHQPTSQPTTVFSWCVLHFDSHSTQHTFLPLLQFYYYYLTTYSQRLHILK